MAVRSFENKAILLLAVPRPADTTDPQVFAGDATKVDHATVTFEAASETHLDKKTREPRQHEEDVDGHGDTDLLFHFRLSDTSLTCDSAEATLRGETFDGRAIEGSDTVHMVGD